VLQAGKHLAVLGQRLVSEFSIFHHQGFERPSLLKLCGHDAIKCLSVPVVGNSHDERFEVEFDRMEHALALLLEPSSIGTRERVC
jgi:hypothetical protein